MFTNYIQRVIGIAKANLLAYLPLDEASGTAALDASQNSRGGTYTGVTFVGTSVDGRLCPLWDAVADDLWLNAAFNTAFIGSAASTGSIMIWIKAVDADVWTDGTSRRCVYLVRDNSDQITIARNATNDNLYGAHVSGGATKVRAVNNIFSDAPTGWIQAVVTWDTTAGVNGQFLYYINGVQTGVTQTNITTIAGNLSGNLIGNATADNQPWDGYLAHFALWGGITLTAPQVAYLYRGGL